MTEIVFRIVNNEKVFIPNRLPDKRYANVGEQNGFSVYREWAPQEEIFRDTEETLFYIVKPSQEGFIQGFYGIIFKESKLNGIIKRNNIVIFDSNFFYLPKNEEPFISFIPSSITKTNVNLENVDNTSDINKLISTAQQIALNQKANLVSPTFSGTVNGITKSMVGLANVDNTADTTKPVSTIQQTALDLKANLASPSLSGTPTAPTAGTGTNTTQIATTAYVQAAVPNSSFRTLLQAGGSHIAGKVAGTYLLMDGAPLVVSGTGMVTPPVSIFIASADYPTIDGKIPKLRLRVQLYTNDVAPTGNYTFGLYPITRPATSGGAGLCIYTMGIVVVNSTVLFTTPVADGLLSGISSPFSLPSDGHYVLGCLTTSTVAVSAHVQACAILQINNP